MKPLNAFEILDKTGLDISSYHTIMAFSGSLCGFLFVLIIILFVSNIK